jgi:hypothetical protein
MSVEERILDPMDRNQNVTLRYTAKGETIALTASPEFFVKLGLAGLVVVGAAAIIEECSTPKRPARRLSTSAQPRRLPKSTRRYT